MIDLIFTQIQIYLDVTPNIIEFLQNLTNLPKPDRFLSRPVRSVSHTGLEFLRFLTNQTIFKMTVRL